MPARVSVCVAVKGVARARLPPVWTLPRLPLLPEARQLQINTRGSEVNGIFPLELRREIRRGMSEDTLKASHVSPCRNLFRIRVGERVKPQSQREEAFSGLR